MRWPRGLIRANLRAVAKGGAHPFEDRPAASGPLLQRYRRSPSHLPAGAFLFLPDFGVRQWPNAPLAVPSFTPSIAPASTTSSSTIPRPTTEIRVTSEKYGPAATTSAS